MPAFALDMSDHLSGVDVSGELPGSPLNDPIQRFNAFDAKDLQDRYRTITHSESPVRLSSSPFAVDLLCREIPSWCLV
jgi:hypothetical protein